MCSTEDTVACRRLSFILTASLQFEIRFYARTTTAMHTCLLLQISSGDRLPYIWPPHTPRATPLRFVNSLSGNCRAVRCCIFRRYLLCWVCRAVSRLYSQAYSRSTPRIYINAMRSICRAYAADDRVALTNFLIAVHSSTVYTVYMRCLASQYPMDFSRSVQLKILSDSLLASVWHNALHASVCGSRLYICVYCVFVDAGPAVDSSVL